MNSQYSVLPAASMKEGATFSRPDSTALELTSLDAPAAAVMTDLKKINAVTIDGAASLEAAESRMRQRGVRMLFVVGWQDNILGLITATDLLGERPMQFIQKNGGAWRDITVNDIMTPQGKLEVLCMDDVARARVGDIVATLKKAGRQHALVVDCNSREPDTQQVVCGIFSTSQIARQAGVEIQTAEIASTFAEIEALLVNA